MKIVPEQDHHTSTDYAQNMHVGPVVTNGWIPDEKVNYFLLFTTFFFLIFLLIRFKFLNSISLYNNFLTTKNSLIFISKKLEYSV